MEVHGVESAPAIDPECGCWRCRRRRARAQIKCRWAYFVHHVWHPVAGTTVLLAAIPELLEKATEAVEWIHHLVEHLTAAGVAH